MPNTDTDPNKTKEEKQMNTDLNSPQIKRRIQFAPTPGSHIKNFNTEFSYPETMTDEAFCDLNKLILLQQEKNSSDSLTSITAFDEDWYEQRRLRVLTYFSVDRDKKHEEQLQYSIDYYFKEAMMACFIQKLSLLTSADCSERALLQFINTAMEETSEQYKKQIHQDTDTGHVTLIKQFTDQILQDKKTWISHLLSIQKNQDWLEKKIKQQRKNIIANASPDKKYCALLRWYNENQDEATRLNIAKKNPILFFDVTSAQQLFPWLLSFYNAQENKSVDTLSHDQLKQWLEKISNDEKYTHDTIREVHETFNQQTIRAIQNAIITDSNNEHISSTNDLLFYINEQQFKHFKKTALEEYNQAEKDLKRVEEAMKNYHSNLEITNNDVFEPSSTRKIGNKSSLSPINENINLAALSQEKTLLNYALELADTEIIAAQLNYADHLDQDTTGTPDLSKKNKIRLIKNTLNNIVSINGKITDIPAFLYLVNSGCFTSSFIQQLQTYNEEMVLSSSHSNTSTTPMTPFTANIPITPSSATSNSNASFNLFVHDLTSNQYSLNPTVITAALQEAHENVLAHLISESKGDFDKFLMAELRQRYKLNEQALSVDIPTSILQALEKRAAKTKRFEALTHLFAKALSHICKNYQGKNAEYSEHYQHKLNVILENIQKAPDTNMKNNLLAQAEEVANYLLNDNDSNKTESNVRQYRDKSPCHIQASKTVRLIKEAITTPSCSLTGLFSNKKAKIHPYTDAKQCHADQTNQKITVEKSALTLLIEQGSRSEEARKRAVLAAHVFENTLRYLNQRSKTIVEKIGDAFSNKLSPQELLKNSENNDPKYKVLMEAIDEFIKSEETNDKAATTLFSKLADSKSDVHQLLYAKNWSFITFKSQSSRELEKDFSKKELLMAATGGRPLQNTVLC